MMSISEWIVEIEAGGEERPFPNDVDEKVEGLLEELASFDPVVTGSPEVGPGRYGASLTVAATDPAEAVTAASAAFSSAAKAIGLPNWPIVRCEVLSGAEFERRLEEPTLPQLIGVQELATLLDVTKQRASELARASHFPSPVTTLASGPIWLEPVVREFVAEWRRRPGRPPRHRPEAGVNGDPDDRSPREGMIKLDARLKKTATSASTSMRDRRTGASSKTTTSTSNAGKGRNARRKK